MNVSLTPELERFVQEKVHSGRYTSASEVVREALRLLEEQVSRQDAAITRQAQTGEQIGTVLSDVAVRLDALEFLEELRPLRLQVGPRARPLRHHDGKEVERKVIADLYAPGAKS